MKSELKQDKMLKSNEIGLDVEIDVSKMIVVVEGLTVFVCEKERRWIEMKQKLK